MHRGGKVNEVRKMRGEGHLRLTIMTERLSVNADGAHHPSLFRSQPTEDHGRRHGRKNKEKATEEADVRLSNLKTHTIMWICNLLLQLATITLACSFHTLRTWRPSNNELSILRSTPKNQVASTETTSKNDGSELVSHPCKFCGAEFSSRNEVFRHLRSSAECFKQTASNSTGLIQLPKQKMAIQFGYNIISDGESKQSYNDVAAQLVRDAFFDAIQIQQPVQQDGKDSTTLASAARQRHPCLAQDYDCSASSDIICINYKGEKTKTGDLIDGMQTLLDAACRNTGTPETSLNVRILSAESLPISTRFHAEQSCTQRVYHYLLPLEWLDDGREAQDWCSKQKQNRQGRQRAHQPRGMVETPVALLRLKEALRHIECSSDDETKKVISPGRFGSLWRKERRCWHNFADPSLGGKASPSNDPVWRTVDRAQVLDFIDCDGMFAAVVELRGDGFVTEQVRRIVGSVVGMVNGWLPADFVEVATRSDICVETPIAPSGRMYFAGARYHFIELVQGTSFFEDGSGKADEWLEKLQSDMMQQRAMESTTGPDWHEELRCVTSPRIRAQMEKTVSDDEIRNSKALQDYAISESILSPIEDLNYSEAPPVFQKTLSLLRCVIETETWPKTSGARSRVIRTVGTGTGNRGNLSSGNMRATTTSFSGELFQSGSFTVVNEENYTGKLPLGNELFPELVKAVFELEGELSANPRSFADGTHISDGLRPMSTHCAINRNAEFTPHVDSGRGQGQSVSMIVGLGDFNNGSIFVEGKPYQIRYNPLEFDGWKQRHWTESFQGERFSLVWFTPAGKDESDLHVSNDENGTVAVDGGSCDGVETDEDKRATSLVCAHQTQLPSYPLIKFRKASTDALVINEILDPERGCAYELAAKAWQGSGHGKDFSPRGHRVLDIGAHIGVFSRYALSMGCHQVIAYEPESSNLELLRQNLKASDCEEGRSSPGDTVVEIHELAVAQGVAGVRNLVRARNRNDGTLNTWRHSLEEYSQYSDKVGALPSAAQEGILTRSQVSTVPLFGTAGALKPGITFVKLDCEGAEVDILLAPESREPVSWLDVTNLVVEWSFTKERRVEQFHHAIQNLEASGFSVSYEGEGSWWDTEVNVMWPYHNDLVVFAVREIP
jgi:FkbM family methyltransferase